jgi:hypothetical protein
LGLIGAAGFGLPYFSSVARLSEFHQGAGVAPNGTSAAA